MERFNQPEDKFKESMISIVLESWRFLKQAERLASKVTLSEKRRFESSYNWYIKRLESSLNNVGITIINVEGSKYNVGLAVTPLNLLEFQPEDTLYVEQMLEPILMENGTILHTGIVIVGRASL